MFLNDSKALQLCFLNGLKDRKSALINVLSLVDDLCKHVQYCQSDTDRESTSRPDKLLRTVSISYGPYLFVSALGGRVKRLHSQQDMPTVRTGPYNPYGS